jgi:hypothetical protein
MSLHDLIANLEAELAALFARFRSHPAVVAAAEPAPASPVAPVVEPSKPAPVAEPPVAPVAPPAQVISDPVIAPPVAPVAPAPVGPAFNPHKTTLDASDIGGLFEPGFGTTNYTITGPLRVFLVIDGQEVLTEKASMKIDGKPELFAGVNPTADDIGAGPHSVVVQNSVVTGRTRLQVQAV